MQNRLLSFAGRMSYYAVANGRNVGIYSSWNECEQQVKGYSCAKFKKFNSASEAQNFISGSNQSAPQPKSNASHSYSSYTPSVSAIPQPKSYASHSYPSFTPSACSSSRDASGSATGYHYKKSDTSSSAVNKQQVSQPQHRDYVDVYTDGASSNNGRGGAAAGIGVYWGRNHQWNVSERMEGRQTNNRAEIQAACRAIDQATVQGIKNLRVNTDSKFLLDGYTKWMPGWKRNGWKLSTGGPVKNRADFEQLDELITKDMNVQFVHVPGHSGNSGNSEADKLAVQGAKKPYLYNMHDLDMDDDDFDDY